MWSGATKNLHDPWLVSGALPWAPALCCEGRAKSRRNPGSASPHLSAHTAPLTGKVKGTFTDTTPHMHTKPLKELLKSPSPISQENYSPLQPRPKSQGSECCTVIPAKNNRRSFKAEVSFQFRAVSTQPVLAPAPGTGVGSPGRVRACRPAWVSVHLQGPTDGLGTPLTYRRAPGTPVIIIWIYMYIPSHFGF